MINIGSIQRKRTSRAILYMALALSLLASPAAGQDLATQDARDGFAYLVSGVKLSDIALRNVRNVALHGIEASGDHGMRRGKAEDGDLAQLARARHLEEAHIYAIGITDKGLLPLTQLPNLKVFDCPAMLSADKKLMVLAKCDSLEKLVIYRSDITNAGAEPISQMKNLVYLDLADAKIDTTFFQEHPLPKTLTHLRLDGTDVDSAVVQFLPATLTHLSLVGTRIDPTIIPALAQRQELKALDLSKLTQAELDKLREALPHTKINETGFGGF